MSFASWFDRAQQAVPVDHGLTPGLIKSIMHPQGWLGEKLEIKDTAENSLSHALDWAKDHLPQAPSFWSNDDATTTAAPTTTTPIATPAAVRRQERTPSDPVAEKRQFEKLYGGYLETVPSWDNVLSKLRCDSIHSFSSCAQHCFTLLPDFNVISDPQDISHEIIPFSDNPVPSGSSFWWRRPAASASSGLTPVHERLFGMTLTDERSYKSCLLNVCVHDYIVAEQIPGCLTSEGTVATAFLPGGVGTTDYHDLDFYQPQKAEMYSRFGVFALSRFFHSLLPECDLSSAGGCQLRSATIYSLIWLFAFIVGSVIVISLLTPMIRNVFKRSGGGESSPTNCIKPALVQQSPLWPYVSSGLIILNRVCKTVEDKLSALYSTWFAGQYTPVAVTSQLEVELTTSK